MKELLGVEEDDDEYSDITVTFVKEGEEEIIEGIPPVRIYFSDN